MSVNLVILIKCIIICICSGLIGYRLGNTKMARSAGLIEITKDETGEVKTTFVLKKNIDWLAHQDSILFMVWNPEKLVQNPTKSLKINHNRQHERSLRKR